METKSLSQIGRVAKKLSLRSLRLERKVSVSELAKRMSLSEDYLERLEEQKDCQISEFRQYAQALGGNARCSVKIHDTDELYIIDVGYRSVFTEPPAVHGMDMPPLPVCSDDAEAFEQILRRIEQEAYKVTSDMEANKRDRAMGFSARNSVALLRQVMTQYLPVLRLLEDAYDLMDKDEKPSPEKEEFLSKVEDLLQFETEE